MKQEGWERKLADYLALVRPVPFEWGRHDCGHFVAGWLKIVHGRDYAASFRGRYTSARGAAKTMRNRGYFDIQDIADKHLPPCPLHLAQRGDIVLHSNGDSLGICDGIRSYFVGYEGLHTIKTLDCLAAWRAD